ncbi:MAG: hypothetical protein M0C28_00330 [Candidatus Moduliflexus flocculans]|nr:hypothetical protein [Candidatus Moduliflexus flocculans]
MKTKSLAIRASGRASYGHGRLLPSLWGPTITRTRGALPPTHPAQVVLLRNEPRREHISPSARSGSGRAIRHGSVITSKSLLKEKAAARMGADAVVIVRDKYYREGVVYSYWRGPRAVYERHIVGIAIRYQRARTGYEPVASPPRRSARRRPGDGRPPG